ncbi:hypothetical protein OSB04_018698 [Centaurea solstitialis]|uniref:NB-ARC domain-containing protein n=1 Tax=Centaurea solstitialis TaxID=347529 RepID=A0AA38T5D2_9ASTR|nr:hypothetical protein OSB04_018698 [Centaurea solstitialis]
MEVNRVDEGRRFIKSRFFRKKVLIVLDDIGHLDQVKALAGSHDWFGDGSRIIITTRDNNLLDARIVNVVYDVCLLSEDEAIKLFHKHAPRHGMPVEEYEMLSKEVVSYAGGLPLALKVLGSFLRDKDTSEWKSALARLREIPNSEVVEKLKISYDGLGPIEKELFLDIACFFRGKKKDEAMGIFDACGFHPIIGMKVLIQKSLITVSEEGTFEMHDLIEEMGHYIVRGENPKNPEKHSRIWQTEDILNIIAVDSMKENDIIEALNITFSEGECPPSLPKVLANMKELRWIWFYRYKATSFPRDFQPMNLCYLGLERCSLEQLWKGYKDFGQYTSWVELFKIYCRAHDVIHHIIPAEATPSEPAADKGKDKADDPALQKRLDSIVLQWIYGTISKDLLITILKPNSTAAQAWKALENIFIDSKLSRALYLENKFNNVRLESFSNVSAYCQELKILSDQLTNVDAPVSNDRLVLQLINGLGDRYESLATMLQQSTPLPDFYTARSKLILEETRKNQSSKISTDAEAALNTQTTAATTDRRHLPPPIDQ